MIRETVHPLLVAILVLARSQKHINSSNIKYAQVLESYMAPEKARRVDVEIILGEEEDSFAMRLDVCKADDFWRDAERKYGWGSGT
jgi:hypothetical protein